MNDKATLSRRYTKEMLIEKLLVSQALCREKDKLIEDLMKQPTADELDIQPYALQGIVKDNMNKEHLLAIGVLQKVEEYMIKLLKQFQHAPFYHKPEYRGRYWIDYIELKKYIDRMIESVEKMGV